LCAADPKAGVYEYGVRLLGAGIRVDARHPVELRVTPPPLFSPAHVELLRLKAGEQTVAESRSFDPAMLPAVVAVLHERPVNLRLEIVVKPAAVADVAAVICDSNDLRYQELAEPPRNLLLELAEPREGIHTADLLRLLMNPLGGAAEPLGRRIHPAGVAVMGAALTAALDAAPPGQEWLPFRLRLRWRKPMALETHLRAHCQAGAGGFQIRLTDHTGDTVANSQVELKVAPGGSPQRTAGAGEETRLLDAVRRYDAAFQATLAQYREQRAWKVMLWTRNAYSILFRQGWRAFVKWLPHSLSGVYHDDVKFPKIADFIGENAVDEPPLP
jgi:hypothetical protein